MALKRVGEFYGCHSQTVGQKYKSRYSLESRHRDLSSDDINFSYCHPKKIKPTFYQKINFFLSNVAYKTFSFHMSIRKVNNITG